MAACTVIPIYTTAGRESHGGELGRPPTRPLLGRYSAATRPLLGLDEELTLPEGTALERLGRAQLPDARLVAAALCGDGHDDLEQVRQLFHRLVVVNGGVVLGEFLVHLGP